MPFPITAPDAPTWLTTVKYGVLGIQILSSILLILLVLLHSPKSDGVSIGGAGNIFSSQRGAEATLNTITYWTAGIFLGCSFILGYYF